MLNRRQHRRPTARPVSSLSPLSCRPCRSPRPS